MSQASWNWNSLIDVVTNMLGVLLLLSVVGVFLRISHVQPTESKESGEKPTDLPIVHILATKDGLFPVRLAVAYRELLMVTPTHRGSDFVGRATIPAGHGGVTIEYATDATGTDSCLLLKPAGKGCSLQDVMGDECPGFAWRTRRPGHELLFFNVYPDGYDAFQPLCAAAALLGFETAWKPRLEGEPTFLCSGRREWVVRYVQGGRRIAGQSCFWLLGER
ncbi:MAG: hypothetical protein ACREKH_22110 [Candidatus Rokuibacteriota bacterium]